MSLDQEGFRQPEGTPQVRELPVAVEVPKFFDGCQSREDAAIRMINELGKPASYEQDGFDTMYRRLADALILVLANQAGLAP